MEEIRAIARKICHFRSDYAAKFRTISDHSDIRIWARNFNYENLDASTRISYHDPLATFTATAGGSADTTFTITPKMKYEWLSLSLHPGGDGLPRPSLSLKTELPLTDRIVGSVLATFGLIQGNPNVSVGATYTSPYCIATMNRMLRDDGTTVQITGTSSFAVFYESFLAKLTFDQTEKERLLGLKVNFRNTNIGLITSTQEAAYFAFETRRKNVVAGFTCTQIFAMQKSIWKVISSTSIGARYYMPNGYISLAWQRPKSLGAKIKYRFQERYEIALMTHVDDHDFSKVSMGVSFCLFPPADEQEMPLDKTPTFLRRLYF